MRKQFHILNGDSLKQRFPKNIQGEIIVARECLVDGNVKENNLAEFFNLRADFICHNYEGYTQQDYFEKTVTEFQRIQDISEDADINLWFEDDLFCQVNLWFVTHLIINTTNNNTVYLIRPESFNQYGFGGLNDSELISIYKNRLILTELDKIASLWESYQNDNTEELIKGAQEIESTYPFILPAVEAHIERKPTDDYVSRPTKTLVAIMNELDTEEFAPVFKEFNKRESIYGFGDLQVKRLFDEIKTNAKN